MSKEISLKVELRHSGKGNARKVRRSNFVPAVVYGSGITNSVVSLDVRLLEKYSKSEFENSIFVLDTKLDNLNSKHVLIKKIDRDPVSRKPIHVDFYALDMANKVKVMVEVKFEGKSKGEANGGQLEIQSRNLEVECLPNRIPSHIVVNISQLEIGDNIHISDIQPPEAVKFTATDNVALCSVKEIKETVEEPKVEEEEKDENKKEEKSEAKIPEPSEKK